MFPREEEWNSNLWPMARVASQIYDRLVYIGSMSSLESEVILKHAGEALQREA